MILLVYLSAILTLVFAGSLYWVLRNEVMVGRDAGAHLQRTLEVADILSSGSADSLFRAFTYHDFRPPGLYLAVQPFYALLGRSFDSAQVANLLFACAVVTLTFFYGLRLGGARLALLAALMTALWPLLTALTRLFYLEVFVTALVMLALLALLHNEGFKSRRWSLVWGASIGVGLLVKWTTPLYLLLPTLAVLWHAHWLRDDWGGLRRHQFRRNEVSAAFVPAMVLALLWYLPARTQALHLWLGDWLLPAWLLLWTPLFYVLRLAATPLANLATALLVALSLASLWYLPRADFISDLFYVGFGEYGGHAPFDPFRLHNYTRYFDYLIRYDLGLLAALVILPLGLWPWLGRLRGWRQAQPAALLLWCSVLGSWSVLSLLTQDNERNLVPLIPVFALLLARGLQFYPRTLAAGIALTWVALLALVWSIFTFDSFSTLHQATRPLWGRSGFLQRPASDATAPGFWIAPDVLATIKPEPGERTILGMLINSQEIHRGPFRYLIDLEKMNIDLLALTERGGRGWSGVIESSWVLFKDGDNNIEEPGLSSLARIMSGDPLFRALYHEVKRYPLPNGETAYLYRRRGPAEPRRLPGGLAQTAPVATQIEQWWSDHATLLYGNIDLAVWVGIHDLRADRVAIMGENDATTSPEPGKATGTLIAVLSQKTTALRHWLDTQAYRAIEVGDDQVAVAVYGRPVEPLVPLTIGDRWEDLRFEQLLGRASVEPGEVLPIEAKVAGVIDPARKLSFRLLDATGAVVAQTDVILQPDLRLGVFVPPNATRGPHQLVALLYDSDTLAPFAGPAGEELFQVTAIEIR